MAPIEAWSEKEEARHGSSEDRVQGGVGGDGAW